MMATASCRVLAVTRMGASCPQRWQVSLPAKIRGLVHQQGVASI